MYTHIIFPSGTDCVAVGGGGEHCIYLFIYLHAQTPVMSVHFLTVIPPHTEALKLLLGNCLVPMPLYMYVIQTQWHTYQWGGSVAKRKPIHENDHWNSIHLDSFIIHMAGRRVDSREVILQESYEIVDRPFPYCHKFTLHTYDSFTWQEGEWVVERLYCGRAMKCGETHFTLPHYISVNM